MKFIFLKLTWNTNYVYVGGSISQYYFNSLLSRNCSEEFVYFNLIFWNKKKEFCRDYHNHTRPSLTTTKKKKKNGGKFKFNSRLRKMGESGHLKINRTDFWQQKNYTTCNMSLLNESFILFTHINTELTLVSL